MAQLSGGCEKGWQYVSLPAGSVGGGHRDERGGAAAAAAGGVLSTFYVLILTPIVLSDMGQIVAKVARQM